MICTACNLINLRNYSEERNIYTFPNIGFAIQTQAMECIGQEDMVTDMMMIGTVAEMSMAMEEVEKEATGKMIAIVEMEILIAGMEIVKAGILKSVMIDMATGKIATKITKMVRGVQVSIEMEIILLMMMVNIQLGMWHLS